jgi:protein phosphatase
MTKRDGTLHPTPLIESGFRCENGAARDRNEDSCLTFTAAFGGHFSLRPLGLYVVADGMGGQREGHVASNAAARAFAEYVLSNLYVPLLRQRPEPRESDLLDTLERGVFKAHDAVAHGDLGHADAAHGDKAQNGEPLMEPGLDAAPNGGTTLTAGLILGPRLYVAHVGDSRAYLLSDDELRPLTEDHSLVRRLQETGRLSAEDAQTFQYRNVLLQALGQAGALTADTFALDLPPRGKLLLCSDGLCGLVAAEEMAAILRTEAHPQASADRLYEAAMTAGGHDNITAVVVAFTL